jgi:hypothetical protein
VPFHESEDGAVRDPYEEWLDYDRQRLRGRLRELLRVSGRFHGLIAVDPTDEDGHVGIMRAMVRSGDRSGVLRQYAQLSRVLNDELGAEPGAEARAVRDLALNAPPPDPGRLLPRPDVTFYRTAGRPDHELGSRISGCANALVEYSLSWRPTPTTM